MSRDGMFARDRTLRASAGATMIESAKTFQVTRLNKQTRKIATNAKSVQIKPKPQILESPSKQNNCEKIGLACTQFSPDFA